MIAEINPGDYICASVANIKFDKTDVLVKTNAVESGTRVYGPLKMRVERRQMHVTRRTVDALIDI